MITVILKTSAAAAAAAAAATTTTTADTMHAFQIPQLRFNIFFSHDSGY